MVKHLLSSPVQNHTFFSINAIHALTTLDGHKVMIKRECITDMGMQTDFRQRSAAVKILLLLGNINHLLLYDLVSNLH